MIRVSGSYRRIITSRILDEGVTLSVSTVRVPSHGSVDMKFNPANDSHRTLHQSEEQLQLSLPSSKAMKVTGSAGIQFYPREGRQPAIDIPGYIRVSKSLRTVLTEFVC